MDNGSGEVNGTDDLKKAQKADQSSFQLCYLQQYFYTSSMSPF